MHAIRGRIVQNQILEQHEHLQPYLVSNERFSKTALNTMLKEAKQIFLKPILGLDFITVTKNQETYQIKTNVASVEVLEADLYESIQQIIGERNFIMQLHSHSTLLTKRSYRRFITVQRRNGCWHVTHSSRQMSSNIEIVAYYKHQVQIQNIALIAAEQLGLFYPHCESIVIEVLFNIVGDIAITDSFLHFSISKWNQYQSLAHVMPKTDLLTMATFYSYLNDYPLVFLKPCNGQQGKGIIKIHKRRMCHYEIHKGRQKWVIAGIKQVYAHICEMAPMEDFYIIQRGIALATIDNRFSDIRVMTQKTAKDWRITGKLVKVAGPHFFVTNAAQAILTWQQALRHSTIHPKFHRQLESRIDAICLAASYLLDQSAERRIIGFDIAVTDYGQIWVIEGNYAPDVSLFIKLEDPAMYNTIMDYKRMYRLPNEEG